MSRWFRHYAGMMRDDKLVRVAIRSGQTIERVVWIWGAILESASEIDDNGNYDLDAPEIAYFLRADLSDVEAVLGALESSGRISKSCVVKWGNRQFSSDTSAERQRRYRDKKRQQEPEVREAETSGDGEVTSPSRHRDAPETETELDTESSEANASVVEPTDLRKQVFDLGLSLLMESGKTEAEARTLVGMWRKTKSDAEVLAGFLDCQSQDISSPLEWLQARFKSAKWVSASGYEYRGSDQDVLREAERRGDNNTYWAVKAAMARPEKPRKSERRRGAASIGSIASQIAAGGQP